MNLHQLEYLIQVDKTKSFSKAAEQCHVTQATLSAMVKKIEEELELVIFDRKANPILTTDCGKEIIEEAKKALYHANRIHDLAKTLQGKIEGNIRIGIIPTIANALLTRVLKPMLNKYPLLDLSLHELTTENIIDQLRQGTIDFGILSTPLQEKDIEEEILYYEALLVYGTPQKKTNYVLPNQLRDQKIWLLEEGNCLRDQIIELCELKKNKDKSIHFEFSSNSMDTLLHMVDSFGGITLIPELYIEHLSPSRKKKINYFAKPIPVREVSLVFYRPFAKQRYIPILTEEIQKAVVSDLMTHRLKNKDLTILNF
jgi:LysR family hydrogen peroxide-inducible transcriptional activator